jgi:hypothetical protein
MIYHMVWLPFVPHLLAFLTFPILSIHFYFYALFFLFLLLLSLTLPPSPIYPFTHLPSLPHNLLLILPPSLPFTLSPTPPTTSTQELSGTRKGRSKVLEAAGAVVNKEEIKDWESIRLNNTCYYMSCIALN